MDIGFSPNFTHAYELDLTPTGPTRTYHRLAAGIKTIDPDPSETVAEDEYYDGDGLGSADVTGAKWKITVEGDRRYGDPVQDYIASLKLVFGEARKTNLRITNPDGEVIEGKVTIANIKTFGGDANSKASLSCDLYYNGLPKVTPPSATELPESVSATAVSVAVGATKELVPSVTPETASSRCFFAVDDPDVATVDNDGIVTGVAKGDTEISIKCAALPSVQCTVKVTVTAATGGSGGNS